MKNLKKFVFVNLVLGLFLVGLQTPAHAGVSLGIGLGGRWHHGGISVGGYFPLSDYYVERDYYPYYPVVPYSYVVESAPVGAVVYAIPAGYRQVVVNGVTYYEYNGTYYMPVAGGYQVVAPPVVFQSAAVAAPAGITQDVVSNNAQEEFTVNVPNPQGGYTAVNIKRSGAGFVGPQGEFYSEFPKVQQLRVMYTK